MRYNASARPLRPSLGPEVLLEAEVEGLSLVNALTAFAEIIAAHELGGRNNLVITVDQIPEEVQ